MLAMIDSPVIPVLEVTPICAADGDCGYLPDTDTSVII
jgi:hypothetical protein